MKITIWHNNRCGTSRQVLDFLISKNYNIEIRNYLEDPPSLDELNIVLVKIGKSADSIIRKKETLFQEKYADKKMTNSSKLKMMVKNPILIERPIVIIGEKAYLGRPVEEFMEMIILNYES